MDPTIERDERMADVSTRFALWLGVAVPFVYFGLQLFFFPFYPGYRFLTNVASDLGSPKNPYAAVFNFGVVFLGVATLAAAAGFVRGLTKLKAPALSIIFVGLVLTINGIQNVNAGYHPLPDPRHGGHPAFIVGMITIPFVLGWALWRRLSVGGKSFFALEAMIVLAMVPIFTGRFGDLRAYSGLLQRLLTSGIFPSIGFGAYVILRLLDKESRGRGLAEA